MPRWYRAGYSRYKRSRPAYRRQISDWKRGIGTTYNIARKGLQIAQQVKNLVNVEYKKNGSSGTSSVTSAGTILPITWLAEGDDFNNRNGRSIKLKSIYWKGYASHNASGLASQIIRCIVFMDTQQNGSTPAVTDYLETANVLSMKKFDNRDRWMTLWDKLYIVDGDHQSLTSKKFYKKMSHTIKYIGTAANEASAGNNQIYILLVTNEPSANYPEMVYNWEIRYIDN